MALFRGAALAVAFALLPIGASALPLAGQAAPDFTLPAAHGKAIALASFRGRPVYVNFFASWCGPCNEEAPSIGTLRAKYARSGLAVVGVDELEPATVGAAFQTKYRSPFDLVAIDEGGEVGRTYGCTIAMPVHVFVNRRGVVTAYHIGEMSPAEIETAIKGSLK